MSKSNLNSKTLVIVESPGKINKIEHLLGKNYIVKASVGHILDLESENMSIDIENNFKPSYTIMKGKHSVVKNLKDELAKCSDVLIATDKDREGEMIAWSLAYILGLKDPKRIVFNSITKEELEKAIKNPSLIDQNMVNAQKTRRILDRIVGYELSPILWKSIGESLSAGRVQSVVVKLLLEKENEIKQFFSSNNSSFYRIYASFKILEKLIKCSLIDLKKAKLTISSLDETKTILNKITKSIFSVKDCEKTSHLQSAQPPYTTSTLQQDASRKLGFTVKRTMDAAQKLYEGGHITYMRTDSVNLSDEAMKEIASYITKKYGKEYYKKNKYETKKKNTQEAHEAVRPTVIKTKNLDCEGKIQNDEIKLYSLIWKRSIGSQMSNAVFESNDITISISKLPECLFQTKIKIYTFDGFLILYDKNNFTNEENNEEDNSNNEDDNSNNEDDLNKKILKEFVNKNSKILNINDIIGIEEYKKPPVRYNEASLVNQLDPKNLNIGRPSTYASIISKIQEKKYVEKKNIDGKEITINKIKWNISDKKFNEESIKSQLGKETNKLVPTCLGEITTNFLSKSFPKIMCFSFTSSMELLLDDVAEGKKVWYEILKDFYKPFHESVTELSSKYKENKEHNKKLMDENKRILGKDTLTGCNIVATIRRFGPVVMIENSDTSKRPHNIAPVKNCNIEDITLDEALKLLEYPKKIGIYERKNVKICKGKYGLYAEIGDMKINLNDLKDINFEELDAKDQLENIVKLLSKNNEKNLWKEKDGTTIFTVRDGPHSKYINVKTGSKSVNYGFPKEVSIESLTIEKIKEIIEKEKKRKSAYTKFKKNK